MKMTPFILNLESGPCFFYTHCCGSMYDTKMLFEVTGRGGAACMLCPASPQDVENLDAIRAGFKMGGVEYEDIVDIFINGSNAEEKMKTCTGKTLK
jgi:hypothetical protein